MHELFVESIWLGGVERPSDFLDQELLESFAGPQEVHAYPTGGNWLVKALGQSRGQVCGPQFGVVGAEAKHRMQRRTAAAFFVLLEKFPGMAQQLIPPTFEELGVQMREVRLVGERLRKSRA